LKIKNTHIVLFFTAFTTIILLISACKKENTTISPDYKYEYFPLIINSEKTFDVTDITIDAEINRYDTLKYQLLEVVDTSFVDNSNNVAYRIYRYTRVDSTQQWQIKDVWEYQVVNNQAQTVEENIRYVKIIFPPTETLTWNGNNNNTLPQQDYMVKSVDNYLMFNNFQFDSVLTVEEKNDETLIYKYYTIEQYAKHVGLINKSVTEIDYAPLIPSVPIEQRINRGHLYFQKLIKY